VDKGLNAKDIVKKYFLLTVVFVAESGSQLGRERGKRFADDEEVETEVQKWLRKQSKTSMLRVSTHW
jgi:hypothetical protein